MRAKLVVVLAAILGACSGGEGSSFDRAGSAALETALFSDDFNRTDGTGLGPNWTVVSGRWITDSRANADSNAPDRATVRGASCADCRIDARLVGFGSPENGFSLRETASGDRYDLVLLSTGHIQIRRWRSGTPTVLGDAASGIPDLTNWATFAFTAQGTAPVTLTATVNGAVKLSVTDSSAQALTSAGAAGLTSRSAGVWFDDFKLTALSGGGSDGGTPDAGTSDAGTPDAGTPDAGGSDGGGSPPPGTVIFSDNFNRNDSSGLGSAWTIVAGDWITDSRANSDRNALDRAVVSGATCADCRIDARLVGFGSAENGFTLRETPSGDRYDLVLLSTGRLQIRRWRAGSATVLGDVPSGIPDLGTWASFSFTAEGAGPVTLTATVNGTLRLSVVDASAQAIAGAGSAGLTSRTAGVWFDDFTLTSTGQGGGGGTPDGGVPDAGTDAGVPDAGTDAGAPDSGVPDAGPPDAGTDGGTDGGTTGGGGVLFFDDFNRNDSSGLGPNWAIPAGAFITDSRANADRNALDQAYVRGMSCADCRIDARLVGFGTETALTLRGAAAPNGDRYDAAITTSGRLQVRRWRSGSATVLGDVASGISDLGNWASVSFSASGSSPVTLVVAVNGAPRLSVTDASASALTAPGVAGMTATAAGVWFDDFQLTALDGNPGGGGGGGSDGGVPDGGIPGADDWPFYRHDVAGTSTAGGSLTTTQAAGLHLAFRADVPGGSDSNPVVVGTMLYVPTGAGTLTALDAHSGQSKWSHSIGFSTTGPCAPFRNGPVGAAAVVGTTAYAVGGDGKAYAFQKDTGTLLWSTQLANTAADEFIWSSVFPVNGRLYIGLANEYESSSCDERPGRVFSLDAATGAIVGTWWADQNHGNGGGVWTTPAFDPRTNRLFVTTGNVAENVDPATKPWQQAFVAVDATSMQTQDSFQVLATSFSEDNDFGASPTLFDAADGRHLIAATNKNGFVYALNRDSLSAGVLWKYQISAPGSSPDEAESSIVSAAFAHGRLYVAGGKTTDGFAGAIAALDPATGAQLWKMHPDGFVLPALTAVGDVLVAGVSHAADRTGKLYVLDQSTGAVLFTYATPGRLFAQPTWANGMLYIVDDAGDLFAFSP